MNDPLSAKVGDDGILVIAIGAETLTYAASRWSAEEEFERTEGTSTDPAFIITDEVRWAEEVARELMREDEAGVTLLTRMFDKAFKAVVHHGSCAISELPSKSHS